MSNHWSLGDSSGHGNSFDDLLEGINRGLVNRGTGDQDAIELPVLNRGFGQLPLSRQAPQMPLLQGLYAGQEDPIDPTYHFDRNPLTATSLELGQPTSNRLPSGHIMPVILDSHQAARELNNLTSSEVPQYQSNFQPPPGTFLPNLMLPSPATQSVIHKDEPTHRLHALQQNTSNQQLTPPLQSTSYVRETLHDGPFSDHVASSPAEQVSLRRKRLYGASQNPRQHPTRRSSSSALIELSHAPPIASGIQLVNPREVLPDKFQSIFPYDLLNAVQSQCFPSVYGSHDNVVVSAPTGSGKTAILELAICKLAADRGDDGYKIIYQAPTKALCNERSRDWENKFRHMPLKVAELTGDTSASEMKRVGEASIIVTTPEKWDSITRKWADYRKLLQMVALFLIDEVHILKDMRGATLEAVVSRMKTIGSKVRFVALSATVPNSDDIASWLGRDHVNPHLPARREVFGEEFRPVKLRKYIYCYDYNGNDFVFDGYLDQKMASVLSKHAEKKPIIVFCFTRKSCETTAQKLAELWSSSSSDDKMWPAPSKRVPVISQQLQEIVRYGVAFHHAGLDVQDRNAVEQSFLQGDLHVICCTSTLAVGVNLPCHTVVLKGTVGYQNGKPSEYSDLEVMQMLGRAGRPQFDSSAIAIILTKPHNKQRYERMTSGQQILESTLHLNLIEHLNSEVGLQTIRDIQSAKTWLNGTFLSVRLRQNPTYYHLTKESIHGQTIEDKLEDICARDIKLLQDAALITQDVTFSATEYGKAMARYMVQFETMKKLVQIDRGAKMKTLLDALSEAEEFKDLRFKPHERVLYREFNKSPLILHPIKETVSTTAHKISLLVQVHLGGVEVPSSKDYNSVRLQIATDKNLVFERMQRLARCVVECKGYDRDAVGIRTALDLVRALAAGSWEGRPTQLLQIPNIGPVAMRKMLSGGILTVLQLAEKDYTDVERLLSRNPPFGKKMMNALDQFPKLTLDAQVTEPSKMIRDGSNRTGVVVEAALAYSNSSGVPAWQNTVHSVTFTAESSNGMLAYFWRGSMKKLKKSGLNPLKLSFPVELTDFEDEILCQLSCEDIVGTIVSKTLKHGLPRSTFPARQPVSGTKSDDHKLDGFDSTQSFDDGLSDDDLLEAVDQLSHKQSTPVTQDEQGDDEYPRIDDFLGAIRPENKAATKQSKIKDTSDERSTRDPVQLPNGKWKCYHPCSNGGLTKSGKPCAHRCCHEGLDKKKKYKPPAKVKNKPEHVIERTDTAGDSSSSNQNQYSTQDFASTHPTKKRKTSPTHSVPLVTSGLPSKHERRQSTAPEKESCNVEEMCCIDLSNIEDDFLPAPISKLSHESIHFDGSKNQQERSDDTSLKANNDHSMKARTPSYVDEYGSDPFDDDDFADTNVVENMEGNDNSAVGSLGRHSNDVQLDCSKPEQMSPNTTKMALREASVLLDLTASVSNDEEEMKNVRRKGDPGKLYLSDYEDIWESRASWLDAEEDSMQMEEQNETSPVTVSIARPDTPFQEDVMKKEESAGSQKATSEPAWVDEFDDDFVNEFRGLVNFI